MSWVLLHTTNDHSETLVLQSVLESEGIEYKVAQESIGNIQRMTIDGLGEIKIYVPEEKFEDAKELLASKNSGLPEN